MKSNNEGNRSGSSGGIGFLGMLTIALLVLKCMGYINCSWWLVFAPIYVPVIIVLIIGIGYFTYRWYKDKKTLDKIKLPKKNDEKE